MRVNSPEADAILDKPYPVLDKGHVVLVDYLGNDERIVQAARTSYAKGTKTKREDDKLIEYLMRNEHWSPFEQVVLVWHMKMPIFVARQFIRHRTARLNEMSLRYSEAPDEFYEPMQWRGQDTKNKQGSTQAEFNHEELTGAVIAQSRLAMDTYRSLIGRGVAREMARIVLPLSLYTQWVWQMDLRNLFNFLKLRLDNHAQFEAREYARVIGDLTKKVAPVAYAAFESHILKISPTITPAESIQP